MAKKKTKTSRQSNRSEPALAARGRTNASASARSPSKAQLERLDREILELLNRRAELGVRRATPNDQGRPSQVEADAASLERLASLNTGPLEAVAVKAIFRELFSGIRAAASPTRVAYLGPEYTYSHLAAIARFGQSVELTPVGSIATVFEEVEREHAHFGVVPLENSTDGRVTDALECLARSPVQICGEAPLRIRHCLLGRGQRSQVQRVCSKPQALSQCRKWLSTHLPDADLVATTSTAEAARIAAEDPRAAAVASEQAGVNHSLQVLARDIEDNRENITRFAIIGQNRGDKTGKDKTALVFEAPHEPGALADAMAIFKRQRLNLTWIESFPVPSARGRYLFFLEFQGHPSELRARRALSSLQKKALRLTLLGSYAHAEPIG